MTKQAERTEQRHSEQLKQAERRNKHMQEEYKSDLYEVKTKFEGRQRQQTRERDDAVLELTDELRQAKAAATAPAQTSNAHKITCELHAAQAEAREAQEGIRSLQKVCQAIAKRSECRKETLESARSSNVP